MLVKSQYIYKATTGDGKGKMNVNNLNMVNFLNAMNFMIGSTKMCTSCRNRCYDSASTN